MSRDLSNEQSKRVEQRSAIGGGYRIARLFIPDMNSRTAIRVTEKNVRSVPARRQSGRMQDQRRVVS